MLETAPPPGIDGSVGSLGASLVATFVSLGLVCVLAYLALRWLSRRPPGPSHGPLRVLARQSLDPKRSVFVIEAAERCFLVGAGEGAMTLLAELDRDVLQREMAPRKPARAAMLKGPGAAFAEILGRALSRPGKTPPLASAIEPLPPPRTAVVDGVVPVTPSPAASVDAPVPAPQTPEGSPA
jgi:flagellar biosynthetic protein FliO